MNKPYERSLHLRYRTITGPKGDSIVTDGVYIDKINERHYDTIRELVHSVFEEIAKDDKETFGPKTKCSLTLDLKIVSE